MKKTNPNPRQVSKGVILKKRDGGLIVKKPFKMKVKMPRWMRAMKADD